MTPSQIPLALALVLAIGALAPGCAREPQPPADTGAAAEAAHAGAEAVDADAHAAADGHDVSHADAIADAGATDFPVPVDHVKWTPDAPLVEGMSRVRRALASLASSPDDATTAALAADIDSAVEYMFANCQLPTEPDIALHAILARLMANTSALKANPSERSPVTDMQEAVHNYERLFDDPDSRA